MRRNVGKMRRKNGKAKTRTVILVEMKSLMNCLVQLVTVFILALRWSNAANDCRSVTSISQYTLHNRTYRIIPGIDIVTCVVECDIDSSCYSINYLIPMRQCELCDATRALYPINFQYQPDAVYMEHLFRPDGSCAGDFPCENRGTCVNVPQVPGYRCFCRDAYVGKHCQECSSPPLGLTDDRLPNHKITGSSIGQWGLTYFYPYMARLNGPSSWVVSFSDYDMCLDIDLAPKLRLITAVATQGNPDHNWWTTKYKIKYSVDKVTWAFYQVGGSTKVFQGNSDQHTIVRHVFEPSFEARYVKLFALKGYTRTAIRVELYGCNAE